MPSTLQNNDFCLEICWRWTFQVKNLCNFHPFWAQSICCGNQISHQWNNPYYENRRNYWSGKRVSLDNSFTCWHFAIFGFLLTTNNFQHKKTNIFKIRPSNKFFYVYNMACYFTTMLQTINACCTSTNLCRTGNIRPPLHKKAVIWVWLYV